MLKKQELEYYLKKCLQTGADFAEIYLEESCHKNIRLIDQKVQKVWTSIETGIGIRICLQDKIVYGSTNNLDNLDTLLKRLISNFKNSPNNKEIKLPKKKIYHDNIKISHQEYPVEKKKELLHKIDKIARNESDKISQVQVVLI